MENKLAHSNSFLGQIPLFLLASAIAIPAIAQQAQPAVPSQTPPSAAQQEPSQPALPVANTPKEGFWGHMNPFARKQWVKRQTGPINDRLSELDELTAKNARDIQDVDGRAQSGIRRAQSTADAANQAAATASLQARQANSTAQNAGGRVDHLNSTVNGLDTYGQIGEVEVAFRGGQPVLSAEARKQLDGLAASITGQPGYILEIEARSPVAGSVGIQNSERLAEAVKRYLVTQHEIPVYRMHSVALGNARGAGDQEDQPVRSSSVHIRLMENSLAAQGAASPQGAAPSIGAERP
ncbi:MAG: flagellar motor protein MotB [Terracidiphilus sp.]|jgi:outer membrane protein OmpA-like peptidoglycan-associated protein